MRRDTLGLPQLSSSLSIPVSATMGTSTSKEPTPKNKVDFTLTVDCKYSIPHSYIDYYVFEYEGISQSELYQKALIAITKTFVSPKDVVSKVENTIISINSNHDLSHSEGGLFWVSEVINYVIEFEFKDGRMKVSAPYVPNVYVDGHHTTFRNVLISSRGDRLVSDWKRYLFVNDVINAILYNIQTSIQGNDW